MGDAHAAYADLGADGASAAAARLRGLADSTRAAAARLRASNDRLERALAGDADLERLGAALARATADGADDPRGGGGAPGRGGGGGGSGVHCGLSQGPAT